MLGVWVRPDVGLSESVREFLLNSGVIIIVVDRFDIALISAFEQTHCAHVAFD